MDVNDTRHKVVFKKENDMKKNGEALTLIELIEEETSPHSFSIRNIKNAFKSKMKQKHSTHYIKLIDETQIPTTPLPLANSDSE